MVKGRLHIRLACCLALLMGCLIGGGLHAQNPRMALQVGLAPSVLPQSALSAPDRLFPAHAIQNPQGFSQLCRMELQIERQSPVGVWLRIDGNRFGSVANPGLASLRFKVPLGNR
jgi:hypothetical protein